MSDTYPDILYSEQFPALPEGLRQAGRADFAERQKQVGMRFYIHWPDGRATASTINPCTTGLGSLIDRGMVYLDDEPKIMTGPTNWLARFGRLNC